jgi:hypothetical protein
MTFPFDPAAGAVLVDGALAGPAGAVALRLLLDTGANVSVIAPDRMRAAGYDPTRPPGQITVTTAGSTGTVAGLFIVGRPTALGMDRINSPVLSYALPPDVDIDGLIGLDFFEGHVLTLDFVNHTVSLT